jgi:hypothetical protein
LDYVRAGFAEPGAAPRDYRTPTPPTAVASVPASVTTADTGITFTVTYTDDKAMDADSVRAAAVHLVGGGKRVDRPATLASLVTQADGSILATYTAAAPTAVWRTSDKGTYSVVVDGTVRDADGFALADDRVARVSLAVQKVSPPPTVRKVKFRDKAPQSVTVQFSVDVSAALAAADLVMMAADGTVVDSTLMAVAWDAKRRSATWTFPGLAGGRLPAGSYRVGIRASAIADAAGRHLDGNKDGVGGDDYAPAKAYKSRG